MSTYSYTVSWSYDYSDTQPPYCANGYPYLRASVLGPPNYADWWYWCQPPPPYPTLYVYRSETVTAPDATQSGSATMAITVSWDDPDGDVLVSVSLEGDEKGSEILAIDPLSWECWLDVYNSDDRAIYNVELTGDVVGTAVWTYGSGEGHLAIECELDAVVPRGPRVIRFANGVEIVSRAGSVWRRLSADHAWAAARTATDAAPVILPSIARVGNAVCLDTAAVQSASGGTGWTTSPPASVLPTDVAGWPRGADGVRDLLVSEANGKALGVSVEAGALKAYLQGQTTVTLASLGTATVGGPVPSRDSQGRWYVGALVDGTWREWRTGSSWASWSELSAQSLGATAAWSTACLWVGRNGLQLLAGYHKSDGKVRAMWRTGYAAAWSSPADIATVAVDTAPYAVQTTTGQWEIGWRTATAWVLYRAATPGGTWTVVA